MLVIKSRGIQPDKVGRKKREIYHNEEKSYERRNEKREESGKEERSR